jgi:toxin ParE1/3/4
VKPLIIRPAAAADVEDIFQWYETERPGLGVEFQEELQRTLTAISANPRFYPIVRRDTRRALLRRFPYIVYYRDLPGVVAVVACVHGHRDPRHWQSRS